MWEVGDAPVLVCVLGGFCVLKNGKPFPTRAGGKSEQLLATLAMRPSAGVDRESLMELVWPGIDRTSAGQSLNTLVYSLHNRLGDALFGQAPVVHNGRRYRLNAEGGVGVDVARFEQAARAAGEAEQAGDLQAAIHAYERAVLLYAGDLTTLDGVQHLVERERLRARHLDIRARIANHQLELGNCEAALQSVFTLLEYDPCREDGHRLAMRSFVRLGQRAQAFRHYQVCREVLRLEFDAAPEPMTVELYETIRLNPDQV
jgi:DNA-binding SARP family transcriptional activator